MNIKKQIEDIKPEWAEYGDITINHDYNGKSAIIIQLEKSNETGIKSLIGKDIINFLNSDNTDEYVHLDITYGYDYTFDYERYKKESYVLHFDIEYGHYIKGHTIEIFENGNIKVLLEEPWDGGGEDEEILELVKCYLEKINYIKRDDLKIIP